MLDLGAKNRIKKYIYLKKNHLEMLEVNIDFPSQESFVQVTWGPMGWNSGLLGAWKINSETNQS